MPHIESEMDTWAATHHVRPMFPPAILLRFKRIFRRAPAVMVVFDLYEQLHYSALGAPPPEGGFLSGFRASLRVLVHTVPKLVPDRYVKSTTSILASMAGALAPKLKTIDNGTASPMVYTQVSEILASGLSVFLNTLGVPYAPAHLPGAGRFVGLKPSTMDTELSPVPDELAKVYTDAENQLPRTASQPFDDLDTLYEQAKVANELQLDLVNRGRGLDKEIGAKIIQPGDPVDLESPGPLVMIGPLKGRGRVQEKAAADGAGFNSILDLVRATVAVDSYDQIPDVMEKLRKLGMVIARKPKNRFVTPTAVGYRDLMFNVKYPNGHIGELQINLKPMLQAKKMGHKLYAKTRSIEAKKLAAGGRELTPEEQSELEFANHAQQSLYDEAWRQSTSGVPMTRMASARNTKILFFEYNGNPAKVEPGILPVYYNQKGVEVVVYDNRKFYLDATPIGKKAYMTMVALLFRPTLKNS